MQLVDFIWTLNDWIQNVLFLLWSHGQWIFKSCESFGKARNFPSKVAFLGTFSATRHIRLFSRHTYCCSRKSTFKTIWFPSLWCPQVTRSSWSLLVFRKVRITQSYINVWRSHEGPTDCIIMVCVLLVQGAESSSSQKTYFTDFKYNLYLIKEILWYQNTRSWGYQLISTISLLSAVICCGKLEIIHLSLNF